jgi:hypothetical protein
MFRVMALSSLRTGDHCFSGISLEKGATVPSEMFLVLIMTSNSLVSRYPRF